MHRIRALLKFIIICILACASCSASYESLPGYIEGEYTYIASGVAGTLWELVVTRGQAVKQGDLLYTLDPQPEKASVDTSKANIADLEAQVAFAKVQLERQRE